MTVLACAPTPRPSRFDAQRLNKVSASALCLVVGLISNAQAIEIDQVSPAGEVAAIENLRVRFTTSVIPLGDLRLPPPVRLQCDGARPPAGQGRWTSDKEWVFDFQKPLAPGSRCEVFADEAFTPSAPAAAKGWQGRKSFTFQLAAPTIQDVRPWEGSDIEETQRFLVRLNGAVDPSTLVSNIWCESRALGERIPAVIYPNADRDTLLKSLRLKKEGEWLLFGCQRPLPAGADAALVWGPGIAGAVNRQVRTKGERHLRFTVRKPLTAEFTCERERANAPCLPIRPLSVQFSESIPAATAAKIRLKAADGSVITPVPLKKGEEGEAPELLTTVTFPIPLPESQTFTVELPSDLRDVSGRPLSNASSFPLTVKTGAAPPLAKFAASPFGIVEWEKQGPSLVPVSLRHVGKELQPQGGGQLRIKRISDDQEILRWYARMQQSGQNEWDSRAQPMLTKQSGVETMTLPAGNADKAIDVVGIPLKQPGYHLLEVQSPQLGRSLLDRKQPMYVRTGVLVTNLGLHFKLGQENSLVWVTTLDKGRPVPNAQIAVYDCNGKRLWDGQTDANGLATIDQPGLSRNVPNRCLADSGLFITARHQETGQPADMAFMFSGWSRGIEPWRFNASLAYGAEQQARAHTVTDRPLLRAGETVSMKHFFRFESMKGLVDAQPDQLPDRLRIVFEGTGEDVATIDLTWQGSRHAVSTWKIPAGAKLGGYRLLLERSKDAKQGRSSWDSGSIKVEEFRVPLVDARLLPPQGIAVAAKELSWGAQLNFMSGGPMGKSPIQVSAVVKPRWAQYPGYDDYAFDPPSLNSDAASPGDEEDAESGSEAPGRTQLVLDKLALQTDAQGAARFKVPVTTPVDRPSEMRVELSYRDPDGQTHTRAASQPLWPSEVIVGIRAPSWAPNGQALPIQAVALDVRGKPLAGRYITVTARQVQTLSTRKRLVGGFYGYEHQRELKSLGELCSGKTDAQGLMRCEAKLTQSGQLELIATASDDAKRNSTAARSVWVTRAGELWFAQDNDDRIDVIPERRQYEPGETARLQVRMPYRDAMALVSIEREGVLHAEVRRLSGRDPWIDVKIDKSWTPNAYVSVLVLRGRLRDVPWYSFFTWGWREPVNWWREWRASGDYQPPTAMVDLAKPSFKLGMAAIDIGQARHRLKVEVTPQQAQYGVRQSAQVKVRVTQDGQPVPDALIAFAAVDEGLLTLSPNPSWKLLEGMIQNRPWGVTTATAHSEIIGRRHYGRKAVAAGGGGGFATRELFDTLLTWQPTVRLNAQGEATVQVPLNDSLTRFRLVAIADAPGQRFGTGENTLTVSQDLQLLSGFPPLVREGDRMQAVMTLRNATARSMDLRVSLQGKASLESGEQPLTQPAKTVKLAAGQAQEVIWTIDVPEGAQRLTWEAQAQEQGTGSAKDAMKAQQAVQPAVAPQVMQATLRQLSEPLTLPVAAPADALPNQGVKRGGLHIGLQPRLSTGLPGVRRYFEQYPFTCLEQQSSRFIALHDKAGWDGLMGQLSIYQDSEGLFAYFPLSSYVTQGSDVLTAHLLSAAHEANRPLPAAQLQRALDGLAAFVEGRLSRKHWSPRADDEPRRVAAIAALARYGKATVRHLSTVDAAQLPHWPTIAVVDWLVIHQRLPQAPQRDAQIAAAQNQLKSRLSFSGTTLRFVNEENDGWWWLMGSGDANAARTILALVDDPTWKEDLPRLVLGTLGRQERGAWYSTTANLWGILALEKFSAKFESQAVKGRTEAQLPGAAASQSAFDWNGKPDGGQIRLPWPAQRSGTLMLTHAGEGRPWATVQALAAVPLKAPLQSGYALKRTITPVTQKAAPAWSRGDVLRVRLEVDAAADMSWVVVSDPLPTGAAIVTGTIESQEETQEGEARPDFVERSFAAWRAYFGFLPRGKHVVEYTVRLNNAGRFQIPGARAEAMYAPDRFGELPLSTLDVQP